jgi:hypothetical protein
MGVENNLSSRNEFLHKEIKPPDCIYCGIPIGTPDENGLIELPYYTECRHIVGDVCFWQAIIVDPRCPHCRTVLCQDDEVHRPDWEMMAKHNYSLAFRLYKAKKASWDEQYEEIFEKIDWIKIVQEAEMTGENNFRFDRLCDFSKLEPELRIAPWVLSVHAPSEMERLVVKSIELQIVRGLAKTEVFLVWMHSRVHCVRRQIDAFEMFLQTIEARTTADIKQRFRKNVFSTFFQRIYPFRFELSDAEELERIQDEGSGELLRDDGIAGILAAFELPGDFISSRLSGLEDDGRLDALDDLDMKRSRMKALGQGMGEVIFEAAVTQLLRVWVHHVEAEDLFFVTSEEGDSLEEMVEAHMQACAKITRAIHDYDHLLRTHNLPREAVVRLPLFGDYGTQVFETSYEQLGTVEDVPSQ